MNLPDLTAQIVYGRLAWAFVLAALVCALWPRGWQLARARAALLLSGAAALLALPGEGSLTHWLGLAFQYPSALLLGLCMASLHGAWHGLPRGPVMTPALAGVIAVAGTALYLDAIGLLSLGLYYGGFGPFAAPLLGLLLALGCSAAALAGRARPQALALLLAAALFAMLRLPTGNLWDALLDPLLWIWAWISLAWRGARWCLPRRREAAPFNMKME